MDYFKLLHFEKEPFSNSPDPGLFYQSRQHLEALQGLEISVRLKRGVSVVIGDVGTGKTTLSRQLLQKISDDDRIRYFLLLDPGFAGPVAFLNYLLQQFVPDLKIDTKDEGRLKELIKKYLFEHAVEKDTTQVLIIDEGQKLSLECLEILRELLNFETNETKLLQIVIFAQKEFEQLLHKMNNFRDRIDFYYRLGPLSFKESVNLIQYRIEKCRPIGEKLTPFSIIGYYFIFRATQGFPRKIVNLCHQIILSLIVTNSAKASLSLIRESVKRTLPNRNYTTKRPLVLFVCLCLLAGFGYTRYTSGQKPAESPLIPLVPAADQQANTPLNKVIEPLSPQPVVEKNALFDPAIYGKIRIPEKSTLSHMIKIVYGHYEDSYLDRIISVNPVINDTKGIAAGTQILFPAADASKETARTSVYLKIFESRSIESAFEKASQSITKYRPFNQRFRILPEYSDETGFLYHVVLNRHFSSPHAAQTFLDAFETKLEGEAFQIFQLPHTNRG